MRPPWWASRHRSRWGRPAQSRGPAAARQRRRASRSRSPWRRRRRRRVNPPSTTQSMIRAGLRAGDAESLPGRHQHAHPEGDRQCPDAADVIAEPRVNMAGDGMVTKCCGATLNVGTGVALTARRHCGCERYLALPGGSRRRPSHVPHCPRLLDNATGIARPEPSAKPAAYLRQEFIAS